MPTAYENAVLSALEVLGPGAVLAQIAGAADVTGSTKEVRQALHALREQGLAYNHDQAGALATWSGVSEKQKRASRYWSTRGQLERMYKYGDAEMRRPSAKGPSEIPTASKDVWLREGTFWVNASDLTDDFMVMVNQLRDEAGLLPVSGSGRLLVHRRPFADFLQWADEQGPEWDRYFADGQQELVAMGIADKKPGAWTFWSERDGKWVETIEEGATRGYPPGWDWQKVAELGFTVYIRRIVESMLSGELSAPLLTLHGQPADGRHRAWAAKSARMSEAPVAEIEEAQPRTSPIRIDEHGALEAMAEIEGNMWATKQWRNMHNPAEGTFFFNRKAYRMLKKSASGNILSDVLAGSGFIVGENGRGYVVLPDGQIALIGETATPEKRKQAAEMMMMIV